MLNRASKRSRLAIARIISPPFLPTIFPLSAMRESCRVKLNSHTFRNPREERSGKGRRGGEGKRISIPPTPANNYTFIVHRARSVYTETRSARSTLSDVHLVITFVRAPHPPPSDRDSVTGDINQRLIESRLPRPRGRSNEVYRSNNGRGEGGRGGKNGNNARRNNSRPMSREIRTSRCLATVEGIAYICGRGA